MSPHRAHSSSRPAFPILVAALAAAALTACAAEPAANDGSFSLPDDGKGDSGLAGKRIQLCTSRVAAPITPDNDNLVDRYGYGTPNYWLYAALGDARTQAPFQVYRADDPTRPCGSAPASDEDPDASFIVATPTYEVYQRIPYEVSASPATDEERFPGTPVDATVYGFLFDFGAGTRLFSLPVTATGGERVTVAFFDKVSVGLETVTVTFHHPQIAAGAAQTATVPHGFDRVPLLGILPLPLAAEGAWANQYMEDPVLDGSGARTFEAYLDVHELPR